MLETLDFGSKEAILFDSDRQMDGITSGKLLRAAIDHGFVSNEEAEKMIAKMVEQLSSNTKNAQSGMDELLGHWQEQASEKGFEEFVVDLRKLYENGQEYIVSKIIERPGQVAQKVDVDLFET